MTAACGRCSGSGRSIILRRRSGRGAGWRRHRAPRHRWIGRISTQMMVGGEAKNLVAFKMVLSHSRKKRSSGPRARTMLSWLGCHTAAFRRLGGVPATVRIDNEKTASPRGAGAWGIINRAIAVTRRRFAFMSMPVRRASHDAKARSSGGCATSASPSIRGRSWSDLEDLQRWTDAQLVERSARLICPARRLSAPESHDCSPPSPFGQHRDVLAAVHDAARRLRRCRCAASWTATARDASPYLGRDEGMALRSNKGMESSSLRNGLVNLRVALTRKTTCRLTSEEPRLRRRLCLWAAAAPAPVLRYGLVGQRRFRNYVRRARAYLMRSQNAGINQPDDAGLADTKTCCSPLQPRAAPARYDLRARLHGRRRHYGRTASYGCGSRSMSGRAPSGAQADLKRQRWRCRAAIWPT